MESNNLDTFLREPNRYLNLQCTFFIHFTLTSLASFGAWGSASYLFYNSVFLLLFGTGLILKDKSDHLHLANITNGIAFVLDVFYLIRCSYYTDAFAIILAILNMLFRVVSFVIIRREISNRTDGGSSSNAFGNQYQDIDGVVSQ